jgi:hypothetical protein
MTDPELRKALETWPASIHDQWCNIRADCPCDCGHAEVKEAREAARRLVGLADGDCDCGWEHWCNKCESEHVCGTPCGKEEP